jgi:hypothetical protein
VTLIILLTLVLSTAFIILNPTLAQTNDPQKEKAQTLIGILENGKMTIVLAFNRLGSQNITVPSAETAYNEGLVHAIKAENLMNEKKFSEASTEAVKAMQKFEDALQFLEFATLVKPTPSEITAEKTINLRANITRTIKYYERLKNLTIQASNFGYNTGVIEKQLREVQQHLENATRKLYSQNIEGAIKELFMAKKLLNELTEPFARLTNLVKASNTEGYLQEAEVRITEAKENITLSTTLTLDVKINAITALNNSEISLANARDLIEDNNVNEAIIELEEAKKWEEESNLVLTAVADTSNSIVPTTETIIRQEISTIK